MASTATWPTPEALHLALKELETGSRSSCIYFSVVPRSACATVFNLHADMLIPIEADARQPVRVEINGIAKFVGWPGTHRTHLAVEVSGEPEEGSPLR